MSNLNENFSECKKNSWKAKGMKLVETIENTLVNVHWIIFGMLLFYVGAKKIPSWLHIFVTENEWGDMLSAHCMKNVE